MKESETHESDFNNMYSGIDYNDCSLLYPCVSFGEKNKKNNSSNFNTANIIYHYYDGLDDSAGKKLCWILCFA